jgi:hypothetical protein
MHSYARRASSPHCSFLMRKLFADNVLGYASMDNGYMLFDHFRAPRSAMLSRYAEVSDETGAFVRTGHPAVVYGSRLFVARSSCMRA